MTLPVAPSEGLIATIELPPLSKEPWRDQLRAVLQAVLAALRPRPALAGLVPTRFLDSEPGLAVAERTLELLHRAGLPRDRAAEMSGYLLSGLVGMVIVEPGRHHGSDADERDDAIRVRMASLIALPPRKYPNVVDSAPALAECASPDAYYNLGSDMLIAGIGGVAKGWRANGSEGSRTGHRRNIVLWMVRDHEQAGRQGGDGGMNVDEPAGRPKPPARNPITRRSALVGMAVVAGVAAVDVGGFAYAGGWLRPDDLTPSRLTDGFERVYGRHDGFRRNHAKGVSASGFFTSSGAASEICRAAVFAPGAVVPVTGRFSLSGGVPDQADKVATVRGLGLQFDPPGGGQWRTAMINLPVFPDHTPQGFYERLLASKPDPDTGKPDPDAMAAFLQRHPETVAAMKIIKASPPTPGFADSTYHSLNAFHFTNHAGTTVPVRWTAVPTQVQPSPTATPPGRDDLFDALIGAASRGPLTWRLVITLGAPTDPLDDATLPWPPGRPTIDAGTITVAALHTEAPGNARDINFDPLVLPEGITPSADPLLSARSAVYARSYTRRAGEPKQPSSVTVGQVAS